MSDTPAFTARILPRIADVRQGDWNAIASGQGPYHPFTDWTFLNALEESECAIAETGWGPAHIWLETDDGKAAGCAPLYLKSHSQGEYVFDHSWADALYRAGGEYYPKLQCAVPFTPVTGPRLMVAAGFDRAQVQKALAGVMVQAADQFEASSVHITFEDETTQSHMSELGLLARQDRQFHFINRGYDDFDAFLAALSSRKRKNIKKERARAQEGLTFRRLKGDALKTEHWDAFFGFYMDTGARKWGQPYLNRAFFDLIHQRMADKVLLILAEDDGVPIAGALNFIDGDTLYGRYWGCVEQRPFLHFELSYYQAIDYALEHGLTRIEAGAQGEHKLARGYEAVATYSSHWIAHPGLRDAVAHYLDRERAAVDHEIEILGNHTPFKKEN